MNVKAPETAAGISAVASAGLIFSDLLRRARMSIIGRLGERAVASWLRLLFRGVVVDFVFDLSVGREFQEAVEFGFEFIDHFVGVFDVVH